jgi:hypothetical protein
MAISNEDQKEIWSINKIIEELHCNLISTKGHNSLHKYEEKARFLLYKIPIWRKPETRNKQPPDFVIELVDISEKLKEQLANVSRQEAKSIVKEAVSLLFENLGPKEKEYFNKNVRHLLKMRFI